LKPIEFSAKETPNIPVVFGLYATMALPMYFTPILHPETQSLLVDGGLFDNYPISYLSDSEAEESIGFTFEYNKVPIDVTDIVSFCSLLFSGYYAPSYQKLIKKHECRTIIIPCKEISCAKFDITIEDRQKLVSIGRQAAEDFFKTPFPVQSFRRNSVS
jgi:predicted acylesterase/phospholipase RssA